MGGRNNVRLVIPRTNEPSHFLLSEFENSAGLAMVHESVLTSLELVRRDLCMAAAGEVLVVVTDAVRTEAENVALAMRLGWTDEGGAVSRESRHLARYGGIAVDIVAVEAGTRARLPQRMVGEVCRRYFDWVTDEYGDGHVHADNRGRI